MRFSYVDIFVMTLICQLQIPYFAESKTHNFPADVALFCGDLGVGSRLGGTWETRQFDPSPMPSSKSFSSAGGAQSGDYIRGGLVQKCGGTPKLDPLGNRGNLISLGNPEDRLGVEHGSPRKWLIFGLRLNMELEIVFKTNPREFVWTVSCFCLEGTCNHQ